MVTDPEAVELSIPAYVEHLSTARLFAAATARHFDAVDEAVEDLRLAVSEASTFVMQRSATPSTLRVSVRPLPEGVAVRISTLAEPASAQDGERAGAADADGWGTDLLQALVDDLKFEAQDGGQFDAAFVFAFDRASRGKGDGAGLGAASGGQADTGEG
jgi:anti-sigma regulatory factor (Ser/Thr protein kinase)